MKRLMASVVVGFLALASFPASAADNPLAIVAAARGEVTVQAAAGGKQKATFGRALERGDRVQVGGAGAATVVFNDGNIIELSAGSSITIGGRVSESNRTGPGASIPDDVFAQVSKYVTGGSRQTGLVALSAMRSGGDDALPRILSPRMSDVLDARPVFQWRPIEGAVRYRVTLMGDTGEVWSRETVEASLPYPTDAPALATETDYSWRLEVFGEHGRLRSEETAFHVVDGERSEVVRKHLARIGESAGGADSPATHFIAGSYLYSRGFYGDAAEQFQALAKLSPDSPAPQEALGNVYRSVGLMDLAAAAFEKALALTREP